MRVEDISMAAAELFFRAVLDGFELPTRESHSRTKTTPLTLQIGFGNLGAIDLARPFLKTRHTPDHNAVRNAEPVATELTDRARDLFGVVFLKFVEVTREDADDGVERLLLVCTTRNDTQISAATRSKRQYAQNRLRIRFGTAVYPMQGYVTF